MANRRVTTPPRKEATGAASPRRSMHPNPLSALLRVLGNPSNGGNRWRQPRRPAPTVAFKPGVAAWRRVPVTGDGSGGMGDLGGIDAGRLRAVLFDLDDTLINWREAEDGAIGDLARERFEPLGVAEAEVRRFYGGVMQESVRAFRATRQWWYVGDRLRLLVDRLD